MPDLTEIIRKSACWRRVAEEQSDYFLKFAVEYFVFNALLKVRYFPERVGVRDADLIRKLKESNSCKKYCLENAESEIDSLKAELDREPLENLTRDRDPLSINDASDWVNIVEAVYTVRNNLFHGDKYPGDERDQKLVTFGYNLLSKMNESLLRELEAAD